MFGLGTQELIIILVIVLIIFGPNKLPEIGKAIGSGIKELKQATKEAGNTEEETSSPDKEENQK